MLTATTCQWLHENGYDPDLIDARGANNNTALMTASLYGLSNIVSDLLAAGAEINLVNGDGNNALWNACYSGDLATIRLLIENNIDIDQQNDTGATALHYAASSGKTDVVRSLLEYGADWRLATLDDFTALDLASNIEILKLLKSTATTKPQPA